MNKTNTIKRRSIAAFLLLLTLFSMIPKQEMHNFFANHTHSFLIRQEPKAFKVPTNNFSCQFSEPFAESPFVAADVVEIAQPETRYTSFYAIAIPSWHSASLLSLTLRGPPRLV